MLICISLELKQICEKKTIPIHHMIHQSIRHLVNSLSRKNKTQTLLSAKVGNNRLQISVLRTDAGWESLNVTQVAFKIAHK